jgi:hypothetical protein
MMPRTWLTANDGQVGRELNAALLSPADVIALERQFDLIFHPKTRHSL